VWLSHDGPHRIADSRRLRHDHETPSKFKLRQGTFSYAYDLYGSSFGICDDSLSFPGIKTYTYTSK
jgi:hypothetical protein